MKPSKKDIRDILEKSLNQHSPSILFNSLWSGGRKKSATKRLFSIPVTTLIFLFALVATGSSAYVISRIIDKTDYPFIDDPIVIGKWESVDFVKKPKDFIPGQRAWKRELYLNSLVFINEGKMLSAVKGVILGPTSLSWTKGMILSKNDKTASSYEIENIEGTDYMFYEWKSGDYSFRGMTPKYYVLKKVDSNDYSGFKLKRVIEDSVNYTFENDERMSGEWASVDFVENIEDFNPNRRYWPGDFYLTSMNFNEDGDMSMRMNGKEVSHTLITWTRGLVVNRLNKTASKCEIREIDGETFMFYQWKSGDYTYRGMKPFYYVLKKIN